MQNRICIVWPSLRKRVCTHTHTHTHTHTQKHAYMHQIFPDLSWSKFSYSSCSEHIENFSNKWISVLNLGSLKSRFKGIKQNLNAVKKFSSIQSLSHVRLCDPMNCSMPGFPVHDQLLELAQTHHVHRVCDAIQPSHPLSSPSPPAFNLSQHQGLFQWVSSLHQVAKILEFQLQASVLPNEYSGLSSFRMDWFDLLAVPGTLRNLLQHHSSKYQLFSAQLSL